MERCVFWGDQFSNLALIYVFCLAKTLYITHNEKRHAFLLLLDLILFNNLFLSFYYFNTS